MSVLTQTFTIHKDHQAYVQTLTLPVLNEALSEFFKDMDIPPSTYNALDNSESELTKSVTALTKRLASAWSDLHTKIESSQAIPDHKSQITAIEKRIKSLTAELNNASSEEKDLVKAVKEERTSLAKESANLEDCKKRYARASYAIPGHGPALSVMLEDMDRRVQEHVKDDPDDTLTKLALEMKVRVPECVNKLEQEGSNASGSFEDCLVLSDAGSIMEQYQEHAADSKQWADFVAELPGRWNSNEEQSQTLADLLRMKQKIGNRDSSPEEARFRMNYRRNGGFLKSTNPSTARGETKGD